MRKNITAVMKAQHEVTQARTTQARISDAITNFSGSMAFVYIHAVWFGFWILLNVGLIHIPNISEFDPFPFGLLTLIVSLEAIFLSTFVLISQNRLAQVNERRAELDLQVNLLAEQKATKILDMLDQMARELDGMSHRFNLKPDPEVQALKVSPEPQEVLAVIDETVKDEAKMIEEKVEREVDKAVDDITDEVEAVHKEVKHTSGKLEEVAEDVYDIKEELKARRQTGEHLALK
ncbi:MAG TPA: DUF1003 domain-containing protein [Pyrinomonadaceae bacterium]|nr:DUF1003 domain-containing protein [Pyrinomonadaceae bacterium]